MERIVFNKLKAHIIKCLRTYKKKPKFINISSEDYVRLCKELETDYVERISSVKISLYMRDVDKLCDNFSNVIQGKDITTVFMSQDTKLLLNRMSLDARLDNKFRAFNIGIDNDLKLFEMEVRQ